MATVSVKNATNKNKLRRVKAEIMLTLPHFINGGVSKTVFRLYPLAEARGELRYFETRRGAKVEVQFFKARVKPSPMGTRLSVILWSCRSFALKARIFVVRLSCV